jgi:hypothetical protein
MKKLSKAKNEEKIVCVASRKLTGLDDSGGESGAESGIGDTTAWDIRWVARGRTSLFV